MDGHLLVQTTMEQRQEAENLARTLLERRLIACAQIVGPTFSAYWWKGKIETAEEWLVVMKTAARLHSELESAIREMHTYDCPEIIAVPIEVGSEEYIAWMERELRS